MDTRPCPHCAGTGKVTLSAMAVLLEQRGMKQGAAAAHLGLTQSAFSRLLRRGDGWWRAVNNRTYDRLGALAKALGVTVDQLTGREPLPAPKAPRAHRAPPVGAIASSKARRGRVAAKQRKGP